MKFLLMDFVSSPVCEHVYGRGFTIQVLFLLPPLLLFKKERRERDGNCMDEYLGYGY